MTIALALLSILGMISSAIGFESPEIGLLYASFNLFGTQVSFREEIIWKYSQVIDVEVPIIYSEYRLGGKKLCSSEEEVVSGFVEEESEFLSASSSDSSSAELETQTSDGIGPLDTTENNPLYDYYCRPTDEPSTYEIEIKYNGTTPLKEGYPKLEVTQGPNSAIDEDEKVLEPTKDSPTTDGVYTYRGNVTLEEAGNHTFVIYAKDKNNNSYWEYNLPGPYIIGEDYEDYFTEGFNFGYLAALGSQSIMTLALIGRKGQKYLIGAIAALALFYGGATGGLFGRSTGMQKAEFDSLLEGYGFSLLLTGLSLLIGIVVRPFKIDNAKAWSKVLSLVKYTISMIAEGFFPLLSDELSLETKFIVLIGSSFLTANILLGKRGRGRDPIVPEGTDALLIAYGAITFLGGLAILGYLYFF